MVSAYDRLTSINKKSRKLLGLIQKQGPLTRNQIMDITHMKLNTLKRFMKPLMDAGFVIEASLGESTGGRPPTLYDINPGNCYVIGIDISRTYTKVVITNLKMEILDLHHFPPPQSPEDTVSLISLYLHPRLKQLSINKSMILGVGLGTVGPLHREKGIILNPANFTTDDWFNVPIREILQKELPWPTIVDNGANTAALAEYYFGRGKQIEKMAYFNCGIGIRTGTISSGTIIRSINDYEDAFGHMIVDINGELCHCGNYGCVETHCSIPSITNTFISKLKEHRPTCVGETLDEIDYIDICQAAEDGDELSREVLENAATIFGVGLANYINLLSPQLVILSGPLIKHSLLFYETSVRVASKRLYIKPHYEVVFSRGGYFQGNAIAVGAAAEMVEEILATDMY